MKPIINNLKHHFGVVRTFSSHHVIAKFAEDFGLVYFGSVDQHSDEHNLVRGITVSAEHNDRHYCVGNIQGYDTTLVQRTDTVHFPGKQSAHYTWLIMQFDLHVPEDVFGHILLDAKHHDEAFYANLFVKFNRFSGVDASVFMGHEPVFVNYFNVYTPPDETDRLPYILTPDITATLGHHFRHFDFEISGDRLLVYASNRVITRHELEHMLRAGLWLSEHLDNAAEHIVHHKVINHN